MPTSKHPELIERLQPLLGDWSFEISNDGPPIVRGRTSLSLIEDGALSDSSDGNTIEATIVRSVDRMHWEQDFETRYHRRS